jgi:hypothetical protein
MVVNAGLLHAGFFYNSAEQREKMVAAERAVTDERVHKIIELKRKVWVLHSVVRSAAW